MALVAHSALPAFEVLRRERLAIVSAQDADESSLPALRIGLLNLMPDTALQATERQFLRMVDAYGTDADLYVYPFALEAEDRGDIARAHVEAHYSSFDSLKRQGLDALIITGANPVTDKINEEFFWEPLIGVIDWARANVQSILCSCLATHAVLHHYHRAERVELLQRRWGVYAHQVLVDEHPLLAGIRSPVYAPHSHRYDISRAAMEAAGLTVLVESREAGVHMAVSPDQLKFVFFQGHPEYDAVSLLKEFKREVQRFLAGKRSVYPPYPVHYLDRTARERLDAYQRQVTESDFAQRTIPAFPEAKLADDRVNTWREAGRQIYRNWLAEVSGQMA
jgi:homoserine O-succinyltransferase